jgi:hypothetical protein
VATPDENVGLVANIALVETLAGTFMAVAGSEDPELASSGSPVYDGIQRSLLGAIRIVYALDHDQAHQVLVTFIRNGGDIADAIQVARAHWLTEHTARRSGRDGF